MCTHTHMHTIYIYTHARAHALTHTHTQTHTHSLKHAHAHTQGVSQLVNITAGGDFLGLCDQRVHINMYPNLDYYGVMGIF